MVAPDQLQRRFAVGRVDDLVALELEVDPTQLANVIFVVDDKYPPRSHQAETLPPPTDAGELWARGAR